MTYAKISHFVASLQTSFQQVVFVRLALLKLSQVWSKLLTNCDIFRLGSSNKADIVMVQCHQACHKLLTAYSKLVTTN